ncbi:hypothetical protein COV81_05090 [Candidatus Peregrinibacteria bacterium CG11_big_fil_rev_8_21_14_0_20_41_10]|nr:MAG: hypothetical protein COV81_05090 [Candidatus Peregrinibacteria bacterium CG11_big_fil_rev_8_21_14_0_20_41_10]PIZ76203.1 MAG: hypothetical protein COY06_02255 [Candidatus Peregrinibacteria bacterium CG_4_10_14_0_2_um_filter_41_8]PJC37704.1 MAG: hypothetical protein CO045_04405 [Candidatus Peregrinibacteria bacterium CG_4_9_14_0_2_um_filter_41_14]
MFKKSIAQITLLAVLFSLQPFGINTANASVFLDVPTTHRYATAIEDLYNRNIIEGYADGRFGPNKYLNRAELTKIVIESLNLPTEAGSCFPDVPQGEWFNVYVCTAKNLGWIEGYPNGNFKPSQTINHAEAVKIIARAQAWQVNQPTKQVYSDVPTNQWFSPYVTYGKEHNFLPFTNTFLPAGFTTRGEFSEIFHRILVTADNNTDIYSLEFSQTTNSNSITPEVIVNPDDIQITDEIVNGQYSTDGNHTFSASTFSGINLDQNLPKAFYKNEVYYIDGQLDSDSYKSVFAFIYPRSNSNDTTIFKTTVTNRNFSIPVRFDQTGDYYIGIIPGTTGSSKVAPITINADIPSPSTTTTATAPTNLNLGYEIDNTFVSFTTNGNIRHIKFSQNNNEVTYFSRQLKDKVAVIYTDFVNFNEGTVNVSVSSAMAENIIPLESLSPWSTATTKSFSAVTHQFTEITNSVSTNSLPTSYSPNQKVTISGTTTTEITSKLSIILPTGFVQEQNTTGAIIAAGSNFSFDYTPTQNGTYILEINNTNGIAVINHPIYSTNLTPLIPNYFDLFPLELTPNITINETTEINNLLSLINQARQDHNLPPVTLNTELSALSRAHNQNMIDNDYFGHVNLSGETPNDRRVLAGIATVVGENIARTTSTTHGHEGFMRSAIHRDNILDPSWNQVGLSVLKDNEGYYYLGEEFTTTEDYAKSYIIQQINDARSTNLTQDDILNTGAQSWSQLMVDNNFVNTSYNGQSIFDTLSSTDNYTNLKVYIVASGSIPAIVTEFLSHNEVTSWQFAGIGLRTSNDGSMKATLLIAQ